MNMPSIARVPHVPYSASCKHFSFDQTSVFDFTFRFPLNKPFAFTASAVPHNILGIPFGLWPVSEDPGLDYPMLPIPTEATSNPVSPNEIRQIQWLALIRSSFMSRHMRAVPKHKSRWL